MGPARRLRYHLWSPQNHGTRRRRRVTPHEAAGTQPGCASAPGAPAAQLRLRFFFAFFSLMSAQLAGVPLPAASVALTQNV